MKRRKKKNEKPQGPRCGQCPRAAQADGLCRWHFKKKHGVDAWRQFQLGGRP